MPRVQTADLPTSQFLTICRANFLNYEGAFYQHEEGLLNDDAVATVLAGVRSVAGNRGFRVAWKSNVRRGHAGRFQDFMDGVIASASLEPRSHILSVDDWRAAYRRRGNPAGHQGGRRCLTPSAAKRLPLARSGNSGLVLRRPPTHYPSRFEPTEIKPGRVSAGHPIVRVRPSVSRKRTRTGRFAPNKLGCSAGLFSPD